MRGNHLAYVATQGRKGIKEYTCVERSVHDTGWTWDNMSLIDSRKIESNRGKWNRFLENYVNRIYHVICPARNTRYVSCRNVGYNAIKRDRKRYVSCHNDTSWGNICYNKTQPINRFRGRLIKMNTIKTSQKWFIGKIKINITR